MLKSPDNAWRPVPGRGSKPVVACMRQTALPCLCQGDIAGAAVEQSVGYVDAFRPAHAFFVADLEQTRFGHPSVRTTNKARPFISECISHANSGVLAMAKAVATVSVFGSQAQSIRARKLKVTQGGCLSTFLRPINVLPDRLDKFMR